MNVHEGGKLNQASSLISSIELIDWGRVGGDLNQQGFATVKNLLGSIDCDALCQSYDQDKIFRSTIKMERYSFGAGEYRYFDYPLPGVVQTIRTACFPHLAKIANGWNKKLGIDQTYPDTLTAYSHTCHAKGQTRPTPLILKYGEGDYNCLHQDLYGDMVFPIQLAILLNEPLNDTGIGDFSGGEFVLTEQRPRMQSKVNVVPMKKGDLVAFAVNERPMKGTKGYYRVKIRHGVSRVLSGNRHVLGVIFHEAK